MCYLGDVAWVDSIYTTPNVGQSAPVRAGAGFNVIIGVDLRHC